MVSLGRSQSAHRPLDAAEVLERLAAALGAEQPRIFLLPDDGDASGASGVLAHLAFAAAAGGQRVVWSSGSACRLKEAVMRLRSGEGQLPPGCRIAVRVGLVDRVSPSRTRRLRRALAMRGGRPDTLARLDHLAAQGGLLAEHERDGGALPYPASLLCLTAACPREEVADHAALYRAATDATIILQSHATTLREARFGRLRADLVLLDHADALPAAAASAAELRLPLADIDALARRAGTNIAAALAALKACGGERVAWCNEAMAHAIRAIATGLSPDPAAPRHHEPEIAEAVCDMVVALRDAARWTEDSGRQEGGCVGVALVQEAGPTLAAAAIHPAAWLGPALRDRRVVLVGAGISHHGARQELGIAEIEPLPAGPAPASLASFHLAERQTPPPFASAEDEELEQRPEPGFYDAAARMIEAARAQGGRTLVVCGGFGDVAQLQPRLGAALLLHHRGEDLAPLLTRFVAMRDSVLVTPAGWAGLEIEDDIANRVILRLPVGRRDAVREALLRQLMERRGRASGDIEALLRREARREAMRRMAQVLAPCTRPGVATLWIADPRFPLPAGMVVEVWRGLTQGPAAAWQELAAAIPRRLRIPCGRSAYDRARVFGRAP